MAKYIEIEEHSELCNRNKKNGLWGNHCALNPKIFVFVLDAEFIVLKTPECDARCSDVDYLEPIIEQIIKSKTIETTYKIHGVNKSIKDEDFRNLRIRGVELNNNYSEVNYIYSNAATNFYLISEMDLNYNMVGGYNDKLSSSFKSIKNKIKGVRNESYIITKLNELYNINLINDWSSDLERIKTVDILIKKLKKCNQ